jgi:hypothetical protein
MRKPILGQRVLPQHPLAQGLLAFWPFNEGTGPTVGTGTPVATPPWDHILHWQDPTQSWAQTPEGPVGTFLDGVNYVGTDVSTQFGGLFSLTPMSDVPSLTFACRFQMADLTGNRGVLTLGRSTVVTAPLYVLQRNLTALWFYVHVPGWYQLSGVTVQVNQWYTTAWALDTAVTPNQHAHYCDGVLAYPWTPITIGAPLTPAKTFVGSNWNTGTSQGRVDWLACWTRVLSPAEMLAIADPAQVWAMFAPLHRRTRHARVGSRGM